MLNSITNERGKHMKRRIVAILTAVALIVPATGIFAFAADVDQGSISGGWAEFSGYYIDGVPGTTDTYTSGTPVVPGLKVASTLSGIPSPTPDKHTGKRLQRLTKAEEVEYAAYGETVWYHKKHYTTAQMELIDGTVKTTSGRQWDDNATHATSPYYLPKLFENTEARTYWGS